MNTNTNTNTCTRCGKPTRPIRANVLGDWETHYRLHCDACGWYSNPKPKARDVQELRKAMKHAEHRICQEFMQALYDTHVEEARHKWKPSS